MNVSNVYPTQMLTTDYLHKASLILKSIMFADNTNLFLSNKDLKNDLMIWMLSFKQCQFGLRQINSLWINKNEVDTFSLTKEKTSYCK